MEFRMEKGTFALVSALLLSAPAAIAQTEFRYDVWYGHSRPPYIKKVGNIGALFITSSGILFQQRNPGVKLPKHSNQWFWDYRDIQQLKIEPRSLTVLTYNSDKWKLGADRQYQFDLVSEQTFQEAYAFLEQHLDQRFVAGLAERLPDLLWEIPVKHLLRFGGDEGVLRIGTDMVVYSSEKAGESRTWRYEDIENISSSGPFQLTVTTFEKAAAHYGDLKGFNFALKQQLDEAHYNDLWLRLNQSKGLKILDAYSLGSAGPGMAAH
jgi:hypothetical protein